MSNQNNPPTETDIAALAQKFWEEEGKPEGKAEEHWQRAEEQLRQPEEAGGQSEAPKA